MGVHRFSCAKTGFNATIMGKASTYREYGNDGDRMGVCCDRIMGIQRGCQEPGDSDFSP